MHLFHVCLACETFCCCFSWLFSYSCVSVWFFSPTSPFLYHKTLIFSPPLLSHPLIFPSLSRPSPSLCSIREKFVEVDLKPVCKHCYERLPDDMKRRLAKRERDSKEKKKKPLIPMCLWSSLFPFSLHFSCPPFGQFPASLLPLFVFNNRYSFPCYLSGKRQRFSWWAQTNGVFKCLRPITFSAFDHFWAGTKDQDFDLLCKHKNQISHMVKGRLCFFGLPLCLV